MSLRRCTATGRASRLAWMLVVLMSCADGSDDGVPVDTGSDVALDTAADETGPDADDADDGEADDTVPDTADAGPAPLGFVAVTFNTGTGPTPPETGNGGWGPEQKEISDTWYGNGLAWKAMIADTRAFFDAVAPDVVVFQEIFWPGDCDGIPLEATAGFVCEDALGEDATVAAMVLGPGWQVTCNPGNPDKCAAVRRTFGTFRGCDGDTCLDAMTGSRIEGCGGGARVAAIPIDLADGSGAITLVNVHGTSGFEASDQQCRVRQVERIFVGEGDEAPLVTDDPNLVLGDFNTDPGRMAASDPSAARWTDFVGDGTPFRFLTEVGRDAEPTYVLLNIDHVVSDRIDGTCRHPGVGDGGEPVTDLVFFDHRPAVCDLVLAR